MEDFKSLQNNMVVQELDEDGKRAVLKEWEDDGADQSTLMTLETDLHNCHVWHSVIEANKTNAVFEIRPVFAEYVKMMAISFTPRFDLLNEGDTFEDAKDELLRFIAVLTKIFLYMLQTIETDKFNKFKIHSTHPNESFFFFKFAEILKDEYKDKYKVKFYRNWIEIELT